MFLGYDDMYLVYLLFGVGVGRNWNYYYLNDEDEIWLLMLNEN